MLYNIHFSPTGGTRRVADLLAQGFGGEWVELDLCDRRYDFSRHSFGKEDMCLISVPAYGGRVPAAALERLGKMTGQNTPVILAAVFGNRAIDDTLLELKDTLTPAGFRCVGAVAAVAEHSIVRQVATARPNTDDRRILLDFGRQLRKKFGQTEVSEIDVPGNRPYRAYGGSPLKPTGSASCIHCGLCAQECPVGAIPEDEFTGVDKARCISCFRCIRVCPAHCRSVPARPMAATAARLKSGCSEPRENTLFL